MRKKNTLCTMLQQRVDIIKMINIIERENTLGNAQEIHLCNLLEQRVNIIKMKIIIERENTLGKAQEKEQEIHCALCTRAIG